MWYRSVFFRRPRERPSPSSRWICPFLQGVRVREVFDERFDNAAQFPIAAKAGLGHVSTDPDSGKVTCAQFCAHHQTLLGTIERAELLANAWKTRFQWQSVAISSAQCKLLILRACNPWAQGVGGSNPPAPTNYLSMAFQQLTRAPFSSFELSWPATGAQLCYQHLLLKAFDRAPTAPSVRAG